MAQIGGGGGGPSNPVVACDVIGKPSPTVLRKTPNVVSVTRYAAGRYGVNHSSGIPGDQQSYGVTSFGELPRGSFGAEFGGNPADCFINLHDLSGNYVDAWFRLMIFDIPNKS